MSRRESPSDWRALAFAAGLLAITLHLLQPLAHAAALRDGGSGSSWAMLCKAAAATPGEATDDAAPAAATHECCLGLAHAPAIDTPSTAFTAVEFFAAPVAAPSPADQLTPVGIRDGPNQPRGPPFLA